MCVLTAAIGRPTLDPWVQPLIALFCYTHVCADSCNWLASPQLTSSATLTCVCKCVCVCALAAAIGLPKF